MKKHFVMFLTVIICTIGFFQVSANAKIGEAIYGVRFSDFYSDTTRFRQVFKITGAESYCEDSDISDKTVYVDGECTIEILCSEIEIYEVGENFSFDEFIDKYWGTKNAGRRDYLSIDNPKEKKATVLKDGTYMAMLFSGGDGSLTRIVVGKGEASKRKYKVGDVINSALKTDIVARINGHDIPSYNVEGYTYIVAEDLKDYGFDVIYEEATRSLFLARNYEKTEVSKAYVKPYVAADKVGEKAHDILFTDIRTYLGGTQVNSYNINGQTIVRFDELGLYGDVTYDDKTRTISLRLLGLRIKGSDKVETVYRIFFDANGAVVTDVPKNLANFTGDFTIPTDNIPFRNHYKFLGYSTNMNADEGEYQPGTKLCINSDMTLYAIWKSEYTYNIEKLVFSIIEGTNPESKIGDAGDKYWREITGLKNLDGWCGAYVTWLMKKVHVGWDSGVENVKTSPPTQKKVFVDNGCYHSKDSGYKPKTGDIAFFYDNIGHCGMVVVEEDGSIGYIHGNYHSTAVEEKKLAHTIVCYSKGCTYKPKDHTETLDGVLIGYGDMEALLNAMEEAGV